MLYSDSNIFHQKNRSTFILIRKVCVLRNLTVNVLSLCLLSESVSKGPKLETLDFAFYIGSTPTSFHISICIYVYFTFILVAMALKSNYALCHLLCMYKYYLTKPHVCCMNGTYVLRYHVLHKFKYEFPLCKFCLQFLVNYSLLVFNYHWTFSKFILNYKMQQLCFTLCYCFSAVLFRYYFNRISQGRVETTQKLF